MTDALSPDLAGLYEDTRTRLTALVATLDAGALATPVPACPGWTVRDVISHLTATPEDAVSGRLKGLPNDEYTAGQVARLADVPVGELLERWAAAAPRFEEAIAAARIWPAVIDLATHEQDIRGALALPGGRDCEAIRQAVPNLLSRLSVPVPLRITTEDGDYAAGPDATEHLRLQTTRFEAFRWRMGRRSRSQLERMAWSADPSPVLEHLAVFPPAAADIIE